METGTQGERKALDTEWKGPLVDSLQAPPQGREIDPWLSASPGEMIVTNC